jgi:cholesterol transport system auxiliary component
MRLAARSTQHAALVLALLCFGCVSLERSFPEKRYFVIEVQESKPANPGNGQTVSIPNFQISPRYADRDFVYRTSQTEYESDFYNQFLTPPAVMITEETRKALASSSGFKFVVGASSPLTANFVLEGAINALYGDFRSPGAPAAVLEIEIFLHNENPANPGIVLHKRYMKSVGLKERSPEALVRGWSQALEAIVAMFIADSEALKL